MKRREIWTLAASLLLASCGGDNNAIVSVPPPPPPPAPFPLKTSLSFETIPSTLTYNDPANGAQTFNSLAMEQRGSTVTFSYDAVSGTYTVKGNGSTASFGQGDQISDTAYSDTFSKTAGATTDSIKLYGNARSDTQGTAPVVLSYTSYGIWTHSDSATALTSKTYFLYGQATGAGNMPTTGTASYQMTASAHAFDAGVSGVGEATRVTGSATLNANFGTGTIDTVLKFGATYTGTGKISADQFAGTFSSNDPAFMGGKFNGGFFGPGAKEAGYTFQITRHVADPYAGASVQPYNTYIAGVALGPKS